LLIVAALILPMAVLAIVLVVAAILPSIASTAAAGPRTVRARSSAHRSFLPLRSPPVLLA
jgi:hypothetical protein